MASRTVADCVAQTPDLSTLEKPAAELREFVRKLPSSPAGAAEKRQSARLPFVVELLCTPFDAEQRQCGMPFLALCRNVSMGGVSVFHSRPTAAKYLLVRLDRGEKGPFQVLVKILSCDPLEQFFHFRGQFVTNGQK